MEQRRQNHLKDETSPYLLQHAGNPVDWYPWGEEALALARNGGKPILLSIGYSACHWCHVMAHESFENEATASIMNANFINIKVDREERPDLDTVYMQAVQAITGSGGWPLTVFLTPEGKPFYGGTYFPPEDRHGLPGFRRVLIAVSNAYGNRRGEVESSSQQIVAALQLRSDVDASPLQPAADSLERAYANLKQEFDHVNGGFGGAPKFPQPMLLEFLLRHYQRSGDREALEMATLTLEQMAGGGIYDQIGGGFHRYATDSRWLVPHFEKMLYDNALLSRIYLQAYLVTRQPLFRRIAVETIDYVLREMTAQQGAPQGAPQGGFYSALDADSEGEEGRYYLWTPDEIVKALGDERGNAISGYYGVSQSGNFEGRNILHVPGGFRREEPAGMTQAKALLLGERARRIRPGRDEKILASWNGMMLASLAEAASVFNRKDYLLAAVACGNFISGPMSPNGQLMHVYSQGKPKIDAYLEDYAQVIEGYLSLHGATFSGRWLHEAIRLGYAMLDEFWDESDGLFYDTGKRHQGLFLRPQECTGRCASFRLIRGCLGPAQAVPPYG